MALGLNAVASGADSVAVGEDAAAVGKNTAVGFGAQATGAAFGGSSVFGRNADDGGFSGTTVLGDGGLATGQNCVVIGSGSQGSGDSVVVGEQAVASGSGFPTAVGRQASATGGGSATAIGALAIASANGSQVFGRQATDAGFSEALLVGSVAAAAGVQATGIGISSIAHQRAVALGYDAHTTAPNQFVVGSAAATISTVYIGSGVERDPGGGTIGSVTFNGTSAITTADKSGADIVWSPGKGIGSGIGSSLIVQTPSVLAPGTTLQTSTIRMTLNEVGAAFTVLGSFPRVNLGSATEAVSAGDFAAGDAPATGLFYDASTATLRVGTAGSGEISCPGPGFSNEQFGNLASATGGQNCLAAGASSIANQNSTTAVGTSAQATGVASTAVGNGAKATASFSNAFGVSSTAGHSPSMVFGNGAATTAFGQIVFGNFSGGFRYNSMYLGSGVASPGFTSDTFTIHATGGTGTDISGASLLVATGIGSGAAARSTFAIQTPDPTGSGTTPQTQVNRIFIGLDGRVTIPGVGTDSTRIGVGADATANNTVAIGTSAEASLAGAVGIGNSALASGQDSVALGNGSSATQLGAVGIGDASLATGAIGVVAIGRESEAIAGETTAVGFRAKATVLSASCFGWTSNAVNQASAFGARAKANGNQSMALGYLSETAVASVGCIVIGASSATTHTNTVVMGRSAVSTANQQFVVGSTMTQIRTVYIGNGVEVAAPPSDVTLHTTSAVGVTDIAGTSWIFASGKGTGVGLVSGMTFQTPSVVGAGTDPQTLTTRLFLDEAAITIGSADNEALTLGLSGAPWAVAGATPAVTDTGWATFTNLSTLKTVDADAASNDQLADILGTLIEQLKAKGVLAA